MDGTLAHRLHGLEGSGECSRPAPHLQTAVARSSTRRLSRQLRRADKLDFASWGGFAQNFSERRIPFEHPSLTAIWEKTQAEHLFIPTFAANHNGPYLPGSAIKGALRTGLAFTRWSPATIEKLASALESERMPRRLSESSEANSGASQIRILAASDSAAVSKSAFKIYLTRVANLDSRPGALAQVNWKVVGRGNVPANRLSESTPAFVEMAAPGTEFGGATLERKFLENPQLLKALGWRSVPDLALIVNAANEYAAAQLEVQSRFAESAGLPGLQRSVAQLQEQSKTIRDTPGSCLLSLGWGGGFLSKSSFLQTENESFRKLLRGVPAFGRGC